jgi:hypothetical protein
LNHLDRIKKIVHVADDREPRITTASSRAPRLIGRASRTIEKFDQETDTTTMTAHAFRLEPGPIRIKIKVTAGLIAALAFALAATLPGTAAAARVSGTFVTYQGQPAASRDLHFENCVTRDSYLAPTHSDGSFAQSLPPGCYDLRAERGAIVRRGITVGDVELALGQVGDLAPYAPARLFQLEALFPTLLSSPAPSTAYTFTHDPTVVPASAAVVPVPTSESEWLKIKKQTEAATSPDSGTAPQFTEPLDFGAQPPPAFMSPGQRVAPPPAFPPQN